MTLSRTKERCGYRGALSSDSAVVFVLVAVEEHLVQLLLCPIRHVNLAREQSEDEVRFLLLAADGCEADGGLAVAGDDDLFSVFGELQQLRELSLCLVHVDLHAAYVS